MWACVDAALVMWPVVWRKRYQTAQAGRRSGRWEGRWTGWTAAAEMGRGKKLVKHVVVEFIAVGPPAY